MQLVDNQEELQQLGIKKKEGQEVPQKVQLVGNQEELQQLGATKKEGEEVPEVYVGFGEDLFNDPSDRYYVGLHSSGVMMYIMKEQTKGSKKVS